MVSVSGSSIPSFVVEHGDHVFVSYESDEEYREILLAHLVTALERDEMVRFLTGPAMPDPIDWLLSTESDRRFPMACDQLVARPADDLILTNGAFDPDRLIHQLSEETDAAAWAGYSGLRVCIEVRWEWTGLGDYERFFDHERGITSLLADSWPLGVALVCHYDRREFPEQHLSELQQAHPIALDARQAQKRPPVLGINMLMDRAGLRLHGDIDKSNLAELQAALISIRRDSKDLHLDLSSVHFADVAVVGLLAETASLMPADTRLVLHSPPPVVRTTLRMYGWDQLPALVVQGGNQ
jgi:anti-anti-sigma regulatory factor